MGREIRKNKPVNKNGDASLSATNMKVELVEYIENLAEKRGVYLKVVLAECIEQHRANNAK